MTCSFNLLQIDTTASQEATKIINSVRGHQSHINRVFNGVSGYIYQVPCEFAPQNTH